MTPVLRFLLLVCLLINESVMFCRAQTGLAAWRFHQPFTVTNSSPVQDLTDYQIAISIPAVSLIAAGKMDSAGKDIRILNSDRRSVLCHWIENSLRDTITRIWVKIPHVPAQTTQTFYLYYGNAQATTVDDGACTFLFFDDFSAGTVDAAKWENGGTGSVTIRKGKAEFKATGTDAILRSYASFELPIIAEMAVDGASGQYNALALIKNDPPYWTGYTLSYDSKRSRMELALTEPEVTPCGGYSFLTGYKAATAGNVKGTWSLAWMTKNTWFANWPGGKLLEQNSIWQFGAMKLAIGTLACRFQGTHAGTMQVDWVRVRQFAAQEPLVELGPEKPNTSAGTIFYQKDSVG